MKFSRILFWILAGISVASCQKYESISLSTPSLIKLGNSEENEQKQFQFTIKNTSSHSITILDLKTSCGCTSLALTGGASLAPGEERTVTGKVHFGPEVSDFEVTATIEWKTLSESPSKSEIRIVGQVVAPLIFETHVADFESVDQSEKPKELTIAVSRGNDGSEWSDLAASDPLGIKVKPQKISPSQWLIHIELNPKSLPIANYSSDIKIHLIQNGKEAGLPLELPVRARITGDILASPEIIYGFISNDKKFIEKKIEVSSWSTDLKNMTVACDCAFVKATILKSTSHNATVLIRINDPLKQGVFAQNVTISFAKSTNKVVIKALITKIS